MNSFENILKMTPSEVLVLLNDVGARVLELIDGGTTMGGLVDTMFEEYEVARDDLARDVVGFVESIREAGIVEGVSSVVSYEATVVRTWQDFHLFSALLSSLIDVTWTVRSAITTWSSKASHFDFPNTSFCSRSFASSGVCI